MAGLFHHSKIVVIHCLWFNHCSKADPLNEISCSGVYADRGTVAYLNIGTVSAIFTFFAPDVNASI